MRKKEDYDIPEEMAEWIGLKKSEFLSELIQKITPKDFGFEEFHEFNHLVGDTIEHPDKAYERELDDKMLRIYVRSYSLKGGFHQVVQGVIMDDKEGKSEIFIPILIFISRDDQLVRSFCVGKVIDRPQLH